MITAAAPFLMFQGRCEEALTFYAGTIPGARIARRHGGHGPAFDRRAGDHGQRFPTGA